MEQKIAANRQKALEKLAERKREREQQQQQQQQQSSPGPYKRQRTEEQRTEEAETSNFHSEDLVCEACGKRDSEGPGGLIDQKCYAAFQVSVCKRCKEDNRDYHYMSKVPTPAIQKTNELVAAYAMDAAVPAALQGEVTAEFLLPEGTINVLRYFEKENPRNNR